MASRTKAGTGHPLEPLAYGDIIKMLKAAHRRRHASTRWLDAADWPAHLSLEQLQGLEAVRRHADRALRRRASPDPTPDEYETLARRGQKAVDELRRVLPRYIQLMEEQAAKGPNTLLLYAEHKAPTVMLQQWISDQKQLQQLYATMLATLIDLESKDLHYSGRWYRREVKSWHSDAFSILAAFIGIMGSGSISQNGPAVHFIQAVLAWAGVAVEGRAIEQALRRGGAQGIVKQTISRTAKVGRAGQQ